MTNFKRLWYETLDRERPVLALAGRLAAADDGLAADRVLLFRISRAQDADARSFAAGIIDPEADRRRRVATMRELLEAG